MRSSLCLAIFALVAGSSLPACSSAQTSVAGPTSDAKCQIVAGTSPASFGAGGGTGTVNISTSRDCTWTIATSTSWVSLDGDRNGQGEAAIGFTVSANPAPSARSGTIVVANQTVEVSQAAAACGYGISRTRDSIGYAGGQLSVAVTTLTGCNWTATSRAAWITITSGQSGNGNGTVTVNIASNSGDQRFGDVDVSGQIYTVAQGAVSLPPSPTPAPDPPSPSPAPTPPSAGPGAQVHVDGAVTGLSGQCPALSFTVNGMPIITDGSTDFRRGKCKHVEESRGVSVTGTQLGSGIVLASTVEIARGNDGDSQQ
jgi:hypothetical protein